MINQTTIFDGSQAHEELLIVIYQDQGNVGFNDQLLVLSKVEMDNVNLKIVPDNLLG